MSNLYSPTTERSDPWAVWPTLGISILIIFCFSLAGVLVSMVYLGWELNQNPALADAAEKTKFMANLAQNGTFLAWNTLFSGLIGLGSIAIAINFRKGWSYTHYLNLRLPQAQDFLAWAKWKDFLIWNALLFILLVVHGQIARFFEKKSDFMEGIFASDHTNFFLLAIAVVLMAPLFEEVFFRGFMFKGLENSWLGTFGTVLVTSFIWAIIHIQYDLFFMGIIFSLGLLFGYARHVTKSLWVPISMHALNNGLAITSASLWLHGCIFS